LDASVSDGDYELIAARTNLAFQAVWAAARGSIS
jgi:hypothetical protein